MAAKRVADLRARVVMACSLGLPEAPALNDGRSVSGAISRRSADHHTNVDSATGSVSGRRPEGPSEQAQLRTLTTRRREMLGCQFRPRLAETKLLASGLEAPTDDPGDWSRSSHALAEFGIVILAAAQIAIRPNTCR